MKTLIIQTTIRPTAKRINFTGSLLQYWQEHKGAAVLASHFDIQHKGDDLNVSPLTVPIYVVFGSGQPGGETLVTLRHEEPKQSASGDVVSWIDRATHLTVNGVLCETREETRSIEELGNETLNERLTQ